MTALPENFFDKKFVESHVDSILDFYEDRVIDANGGYFQNYKDNGDIFNDDFKQLVSSTRIIVNFAAASKLPHVSAEKKQTYVDYVLHGLDYLENTHWQEESESYAWTLDANGPLDLTQQAYGYAFVLLAYSSVQKSGIRDCVADIERTYGLLEKRFWLEDKGLYADEISPEGVLSDYRGQNSNMHLCEAMIAAFEATNNELYLDRATTIATNITQRQTQTTDGLIWEHFTTDFGIDWDYNKDDPKNLYRPWGFQPGHQTEWTKLLLAIHRHKPSEQLVSIAKDLFDKSMDIAWDHEDGGLVYGFNPEHKWCDDDKYFWVQAESFAAAAMLYAVTKEDKYLDGYNKLWTYSWEHMIDHEYGAWFRLLTKANKKYSDEKSSAGAKCDYHTLGACYEVLRVIGEM